MQKLSFFALLFVIVACSGSSTTGDGDAGGGQDGGGSAADSGGGNQCGTPGGTFTCGGQACRIDDQYCVGDSTCLDFDGCPSCSNPSIECGIGKTPSCT